jgi:hypothetical protein
MVGEAIESLIEFCVEADSVTRIFTISTLERKGERVANELKLKGALAQLKAFVDAGGRGVLLIYGVNQELPVAKALYFPAYQVATETLPKIQDERLTHEAQEILAQANKVFLKLYAESKDDE